MSFIKRLLSADFRRALAAEAAADYATAAKAYALAGERAKVGEMHLYLAERTTSVEARLHELRAGVRWADVESDQGRSVRRRIARSLFLHVRGTGVISDNDRSLLAEAAALFESAGDAAGAGECHELAGDETAAADAFQKAGEVDRLEAVLAREETRRLREDRHKDAFSEYQLQLAAGARRAARRSLETALAHSPDSEYRRLLEQLDARILEGGRVTLRIAGESVSWVGRFPIVFGREPGFAVRLRDPGISRRHAEVLAAGERFILRDAGSRNGTFLGGIRLETSAELPLEGEGEIGLGEFCGIRYRAQDGVLALEVIRGLDRGVRVNAATSRFAIAEGAAQLRFTEDDGRAILSAASGRTLDLNGVHAGQPVELLRGDIVELRGGEGAGSVRVEVV